MSDLLNIFYIFLALSGALGWISVILLTIFYWMCQRPPQE